MLGLIVSLVILVILVGGSLINLGIDEIPSDLEVPLVLGQNIDLYC